jgi:tetratricopeptide (TPR) repeat protein
MLAFQQAIRADGTSAEAWAWLGEAKQQLGQEGSAELNHAMALDSRSVIVRALRGLYWKRIGNNRAALSEYQAAAELEPQSPAWKIALGETYASLGDLVSALGVYQRATELAPDDASTWRLLATFCAQYGVQVQTVGIPAAQTAVDLAPQDALALDVLGWNQLSAGWLYSAEENLLAALELAPDLAAAHLHLALVYLQKGDRDAAYEELLLVRELDPQGVFGQQADQILIQNFR